MFLNIVLVGEEGGGMDNRERNGCLEGKVNNLKGKFTLK